MTDVQDWSRQSAGTTRLVASGTVHCTFSGFVGRYNGSIAVPSVPNTTRSLLVLAQVTAINPGPTGTFTGVTVLGGVTGVEWPGGSGNLTATGPGLIQVGSAIAPSYWPFYGLVDSSGTITITCAQDTTWQVWVLAMPDPDLLGSPTSPEYVTPAPRGGTGSNVMDVRLTDANDNQQGVTGAPLVTSATTAETDPTPHTAHTSSQATAAATGGSAVLLAAPAAGKVWEVVHMMMWGATTAVAAVNVDIRATAANNSLLVAWSAAGGIAAESDCKFYLADGLTLSNRTAVAVTASCLARQVTQI